MSSHITYATTLGTLPVECECSISETLMWLDRVLVASNEITDYLNERARQHLRAKCQVLYDADRVDAPRQRFR